MFSTTPREPSALLALSRTEYSRWQGTEPLSICHPAAITTVPLEVNEIVNPYPWNFVKGISLPHLTLEESASRATNSLSLRYASHGLTKALSPDPKKLEGTLFSLPSRHLPSKVFQFCSTCCRALRAPRHSTFSLLLLHRGVQHHSRSTRALFTLLPLNKPLGYYRRGH